MRISRFSVRRPIFTIMVTLIVVVLGGISLVRLPIDLMPDITYPTLSISTEYENASPEEIEELITRPIEEAMSAVPGVEEVTSVSTEGVSNVRVTFSWGTNLDAAATDIRDRLDRVIPQLPDDAERPRLWKFDLASFPILILGASSDLDPIQMRRIIDDQVKYRLERVNGVAVVDVWGGLDREIHVDLHADRIRALNLSLDQVLSRIKEGNVNIPAGTIDRGNYEVMIRTPGAYTGLTELEDTVVTVRTGVPIRLKELATIEDAWEKVTRIVRINGKSGIRLSVNKQSGTNTVEVARGVLREVDRINQDLPQINLIPIIDTSDYIQRSIQNVGYAALWGGLLAIVILLLFLRHFQSTAIIAVSIPISVVATFALLYFSGFTLNIMTIGGLALGVGMLVDNAIVVLENIFRLRETGMGAEQAAVSGSEEVTSAIIASTLTTLAVFLPLVFIRGMSGVMFKQFSFVVGLSLLCSLGVAVTLVPMFAAKMIRSPIRGEDGGESRVRKAFEQSGRAFRRVEHVYRSILHQALEHRLTVVVFGTVLFIGSLALAPLVGVELMPETDEGEVRINAEMEVGTRLEMMDGKLSHIESIVNEMVPEIRNVVSYVGGPHWRASGSHTGEMRIALKPQSERSRSNEGIASVLRRLLSAMPGVTVRTRPGQGLFLLRLGMTDSDRVQIEIRGYDLETASVLAERTKGLVEVVDGITDARVSRESGIPEELIIIDRQKAADMMLTVSKIANMLQTVLSGTRAGDYREAGDEYAIIVKLKDAEKLDLREILDLTLTNGEGQQVVLRNVVQVRPRRGPVRIERRDQERIVTVWANISGRDMGSVIADIRERLRSVPVPQGMTIHFGGDYEEQQKAFRELLLSLVLALVLVYMVMACLYESLRDPFVVMFSVPLATIGVIIMLFLTHTTLNVQSFIGCIMLGGIVVNNAILLVDHTNLLRRRDGMPLREAIEEAGRRRLRPILMTATTTVFGLIPLALGLGEGGEAQASLARVVIGGLISSTLITLVFVPTVYAIFERQPAKQTIQANDSWGT
jgi:HAE1 family hydrophobic/amphiphilic exporter-1